MRKKAVRAPAMSSSIFVIVALRNVNERMGTAQAGLKIIVVGSVTVRWEAAYAAEWSIAVSDDEENWTTVAERKDGQGGVETLDALGVAGRCLRLDCLRPGPFGLYSLWEIEVAAPDGRDLVAAIRRR